MQRRGFLLFISVLGYLVLPAAHAQQTLGAVSGTITDATGAAISGATIVLVNDQTAASRKATSNDTGAFSVQSLSIGTYTITISDTGFNTEKLGGFVIQADRTATLLVKMKVGELSTSIEVQASPQLNATEPTNGYVLDATTIENTPLGTGSFTQLATMSPGVHADPLAGTGQTLVLAIRTFMPTGSAAPRIPSLLTASWRTICSTVNRPRRSLKAAQY